MKIKLKKSIDIRVICGVVITMFVAVVLAFQAPVLAANTFPAVYDLISVNSVNGKGVNSAAEVAGVSYDASKILFTTAATNLPNSDTTGMASGYMRDTNVGLTKRVDISSSGVAGDKWSANYVMSTTGRYVAFMSYATNLIDGMTLSSFARVYVKDLQTNTVSMITNVRPTGGTIRPESISDDGRFVTIVTNSVNDIVPNTRTGSNLVNYLDPLIYDRAKSVWTVVKGTDDLPPNSAALNISSSCDGSLSVFSSKATNFTGYSGGGHHVFLMDIRNGVSVEDLTIGASGDSISTSPTISCNGRYVVYSTKDRAVVATPSGGINAAYQVVRFDRLTGERQYITNQVYPDTYGYRAAPASVSDSGDVVLTSGPDTDLYHRKVYFKHLSDGSGTLESVHHIYQGLNYEPQFTPTYLVSANGKYVVVSSKAAEFLGLLPAAGMGTSIPADIIRVKTGL